MKATKPLKNGSAISRQGKVTIGIFFAFMLLHQTDKLLIGPLQTPIMESFGMSYTQWGMINTGALIVGSLLYPLWGLLYDKFNRGKLLALASLIWGSTTWCSAIARTFPTFVVTRASTGIDDSSYPGMYSLVADLFPPKQRGKVYGLLQLAQPIGYLVGMVLALALGGILGWRSVFYITGSLGIVLSAIIFFGVKDVPRGSGEDELQGVVTTKYKFSWKEVGNIFKKKSMILIFLQGFFGVFPWNVITYFIFGYLASERGYDGNTQLFIMAPAVLMMAAGYPLGGWLGDTLFKRTKSGRMIASLIGVVGGAIMLYVAMHIPAANVVGFGVAMCVAALFMPFASPNVISSIYDVTVPEVRSTANAIENFIESFGAASAPLLAGVLADRTSVGNSIILICCVAWALCTVFLLGAIYLIPKDIEDMHKQLASRALEAGTAT